MWPCKSSLGKEENASHRGGFWSTTGRLFIDRAVASKEEESFFFLLGSAIIIEHEHPPAPHPVSPTEVSVHCVLQYDHVICFRQAVMNRKSPTHENLLMKNGVPYFTGPSQLPSTILENNFHNSPTYSSIS